MHPPMKAGEVMDLRLVRTFVSAAHLLNFRRTAERLFLSQPTVTKHIRRLEDELGFELFHRRGKQVTLTPAGERFLGHAQRLLNAHEDALQDMEGWARGYTRRLVVAVSPLVGSSTLPWLVRRFTAQYPDVEVIVSAVQSPQVIEAVITGDASVGLAREPGQDNRVTSEPLYTEQVLLVTGQDNSDHDGPLPDWEKLIADERIFAHNHPGYWPELLRSLRQRGFRARTMTVSQVDVTKKLIEDGLGISFLPKSAVRRELVEGRLLEVPTPTFSLPETATYLVLPHQPPPPARAFIDVIREVFPASAPPNTSKSHPTNTAK